MNTAKFKDLPVGSTFTNKHGHTYRKLPDAPKTYFRGTQDGKAGRAELVKHAEGFIAPSHFQVGTVVVVNRNSNVIPL